MADSELCVEEGWCVMCGCMWCVCVDEGWCGMCG